MRAGGRNACRRENLLVPGYREPETRTGNAAGLRKATSRGGGGVPGEIFLRGFPSVNEFTGGGKNSFMEVLTECATGRIRRHEHTPHTQLKTCMYVMVYVHVRTSTHTLSRSLPALHDHLSLTLTAPAQLQSAPQSLCRALPYPHRPDSYS